MITDEADFLRLIDAVTEATGLSDTTLSSRIFNDGKKISAMRDGATITVRRMADAVDYIAANWPETLYAALYARRNSTRPH